MIISRAPYRISFFGGGSDYPAWYLKHGGAVLSTSINKYCYLSCRTFPSYFNIKHRIVWSHIETLSTIEEILHPAVREGLKQMGYDDSQGVEIHHQGDVPARSGMGSSSAFSVALIQGLTALRGETLSNYEAAIKAIELEQEILKENVGSQDQVATAVGGLNLIEFKTDGEIVVQPVSISKARQEELESSFMLFYSGTSRLSSKIASNVVQSITSKEDVLKKMVGMAYDWAENLESGRSLGSFGKSLHEAWELKRQLSTDISNSAIDHLYARGMENGALGGKLLGAGGAGFVLFVVPPERQAKVRGALSNYMHVPFKLENEGARVTSVFGQEATDSSWAKARLELQTSANLAN